jgi:hypothetical protein
MRQLTRRENRMRRTRRRTDDWQESSVCFKINKQSRNHYFMASSSSILVTLLINPNSPFLHIYKGACTVGYVVLIEMSDDRQAVGK